MGAFLFFTELKRNANDKKQVVIFPVLQTVSFYM